MNWVAIPSLFRELTKRFLRRPQIEREMADEIQFHIEARVEDLIVKRGLSREEAWRQARIEFGSAEKYKEQGREARGLRWINELEADLRYGVRQLVSNPTFTIVTVMILAIGIGTNAVMFSHVNAVLFKSLPVIDPGHLVQLDWTSPFETRFAQSRRSSGRTTPSGDRISEFFSYPIYQQLLSRSESFSDVFSFREFSVRLADAPADAALAEAEAVSGSFFPTLGVRAILGRTLLPEDDRSGEPAAVAMISYGLWQRAYGGDPSVVGRKVLANGTPLTIVGVTAREFYGMNPVASVDLMLPLASWQVLTGASNVLQDFGDWGKFRIIGRLKDDVNPEQARAEAETLVHQIILAVSQTEPYELPRVGLTSFRGGIDSLRQNATGLWFQMCVVAVILLIACANIAGLLLSRAAVRHREIATRLALGAGRLRLVRQLLTESLLLSLLGGGLGIVFAFLLGKFVPSILTTRVPSLAIDIGPDLRVLAFSLILSIVTGIVFGLAPALYATRLDLMAMLRRNPHGTSGGTHFRTGKALVSIQVALSVILLVGAGLFIRTVTNLRSQDLGFQPHNLLLFRLDPTAIRYTGNQLVDFYHDAVKRLEAIPGVQSASVSTDGFFEGTARYSFGGPGIPTDGMVNTLWIGPQFFETMGIPLVLGKEFDWNDRNVAVVNEGFVARYLPGRHPIGATVRFGDEDMAIIAVVSDTRHTKLRSPGEATLFLPFWQRRQVRNIFAIRTAEDPERILPLIRRSMETISPDLSPSDVRQQIEILDNQIVQERFFMRLLVLFGSFAVGLTALGIYGTLSYTASRRTSEIGIRMALGAQRLDVIRMVVRESILPVAIGLMVGLTVFLIAGNLVASHIEESILFSVERNDPTTMVAAVLFLAITAGFAAFLPARRASRVDPTVALRHE